MKVRDVGPLAAPPGAQLQAQLEGLASSSGSWADGAGLCCSGKGGPVLWGAPDLGGNKHNRPSQVLRGGNMVAPSEYLSCFSVLADPCPSGSALHTSLEWRGLNWFEGGHRPLEEIWGNGGTSYSLELPLPGPGGGDIRRVCTPTGVPGSASRKLRGRSRPRARWGCVVWGLGCWGGIACWPCLAGLRASAPPPRLSSSPGPARAT